MTYAINGNVLQSVLSDDVLYEYKIRLVSIAFSCCPKLLNQSESFFWKMDELENNQFSISLFESESQSQS